MQKHSEVSEWLALGVYELELGVPLSRSTFDWRGLQSDRFAKHDWGTGPKLKSDDNLGQ